MPAERIAMHNIKELLRLKYDCALSHERIARALSISKGVVAKYVKAAEASGVGWAELAAADEARLRALLGGTPRPRGTAVGYRMPDLAAVHQGLKRKNVARLPLTLEQIGLRARFEQARAEQRVAILATLARHHPDAHAIRCAVDVGDA